MLDIGYFRPEQERLAHLALELLSMVMDAIKATPEFDFAAVDLPTRARDKAFTLGFGSDLWSIPPAEALFVHRKIGGMYLLASRLQARVNVRALLEYYSSATPIRSVVAD